MRTLKCFSLVIALLAAIPSVNLAQAQDSAGWTHAGIYSAQMDQTYLIGPRFTVPVGDSYAMGWKLRMSRISSNGSEVIFDAHTTSPGFRKILSTASESVSTRIYAKIETCDGVSVDRPTLDLEKASLGDLVGAVRDFDFTEYLLCTFKVTRIVHSDDAVGGVQVLSGSDETVIKIQSTGILDLRWRSYTYHKQYMTISYAPIKADPTTSYKAQDAAEDFASIVQDFGNTLLLAQAAANPKAVKFAVVNSWLGRNRTRINQSLKAIAENFPTASLIQKISIHQRIVQAYNQVSSIEAKIASTQLDSFFDSEAQSYLSPVRNLK